MPTHEILDEKDKKIARLEKELKFVKKQMANALSLYDEAKQETEKAVKAKGEFMSKLSHEFRTPMNALMGSTSNSGVASLPGRKTFFTMSSMG